jgi:hypothetical protein
MSIPEAQLEKWSHQGSIAQSSNTYHSIRNVLRANTAPYAGKHYEVFLQGSYGNDTNIYAESDVDIVIRLDDCWERDLSRLSEGEKAAYHATFSEATYGHVEFKRDVVSVLRGSYGASVKVGKKAVTIEADGARRKADVIAAIQFRRYLKFRSSADSSYVEGICFYDAGGNRIVNYPKQHSANVTARHQASSERLKPLVRVFKNMRCRMIDDSLIKDGLAPSYYIEGFLYNMPCANFTPRLQECVCNALNWYRKDAKKDQLVCANEQYYLLRDGSAVCWTQADCDDFVEAAVELWNNW